MNREPADQLLDELRKELAAVRPSPEFRARVLAGASRPRRFAMAWWQWTAAAVPAAAVVIGVVAIRQDRTIAPVSVAAEVRLSATPGDRVGPTDGAAAEVAVAGSAPAAVVAQPETRARSQAGSGDPGSDWDRGPRRGPHASTAPSAMAAPPSAAGEPAFEVITNQPEVIRRMLARFASLRQPVLVADSRSGSEIGEIVFSPIEVQPIQVRALEDPLPGPGGLPFIRRAVADAAARSEK